MATPGQVTRSGASTYLPVSAATAGARISQLGFERGPVPFRTWTLLGLPASASRRLRRSVVQVRDEECSLGIPRGHHKEAETLAGGLSDQRRLG
jgi:hypothetical protein